MRRTIVGFAVLAFTVCGLFVPPAQAEGVSDCTLSFRANVMPRPASRLPLVECRGRPAGPWAGLDVAEYIPRVDVDVTT